MSHSPCFRQEIKAYNVQIWIIAGTFHYFDCFLSGKYYSYLGSWIHHVKMSVNTVTNLVLKWVPTKASRKEQFAGITREKHWAIWMGGDFQSEKWPIWEERTISRKELMKQRLLLLVKQISRFLSVAFYKYQRRKIGLTLIVVLPLAFMESSRPACAPEWGKCHVQTT